MKSLYPFLEVLLLPGYCRIISNMAELMRTKERSFVEFDKPYLGNVTHMGKSDYKDAQPRLKAHRHGDTLEICYVHRGHPVFNVRGETFRLRGGDVFLSFPDEEHGSGDFPMDRMNLYWLGVKVRRDGEFFLGGADREESRLFRETLRAMKTRCFRGDSRLKDHLDMALELYFSDHPLKTTLIRNRITDFLCLLAELENRAAPHAYSPLMARCMERIGTCLDKEEEVPSLAGLARSCGLSLSRFKERFKEEVGVPPGEYVLRERIGRAAAALRESDREITALALDLGFSSSQYFATVFRRFMGCSPREYRRASYDTRP